MAFYTNIKKLGNFLLYRGYSEDGGRVEKKIPFKPTLYVPSKKKRTEWKGLDGIPLEPINFSDLKDARDFTLKYNSI